MSKTANLIVLLLILVGVVALVAWFFNQPKGTMHEQPQLAPNEEAPRVEEKYGFSSEGVGG